MEHTLFLSETSSGRKERIELLQNCLLRIFHLPFKLPLHSQQVRCSNPCNAFQYCHEYNVQVNMVSVRKVQNIDDLLYSDINVSISNSR